MASWTKIVLLLYCVQDVGANLNIYRETKKVNGVREVGMSSKRFKNGARRSGMALQGQCIATWEDWTISGGMGPRARIVPIVYWSKQCKRAVKDQR